MCECENVKEWVFAAYLSTNCASKHLYPPPLFIQSCGNDKPSTALLRVFQLPLQMLHGHTSAAQPCSIPVVNHRERERERHTHTHRMCVYKLEEAGCNLVTGVVADAALTSASKPPSR